MWVRVRSKCNRVGLELVRVAQKMDESDKKVGLILGRGGSLFLSDRFIWRGQKKERGSLMEHLY